MSSSTFTSSNRGGQQNIFATEPPIEILENEPSHSIKAEIENGRWAMIGFVSAIGAYATTGQIIPGIF